MNPLEKLKELTKQVEKELAPRQEPFTGHPLEAQIVSRVDATEVKLDPRLSAVLESLIARVIQEAHLAGFWAGWQACLLSMGKTPALPGRVEAVVEIQPDSIAIDSRFLESLLRDVLNLL